MKKGQKNYPIFKVLERVGTFATDKTGWTKEINIMSNEKINNGQAFYDCRAWNPEHSDMSAGYPFGENNLRKLHNVLLGIYGSKPTTKSIKSKLNKYKKKSVAADEAITAKVSGATTTYKICEHLGDIGASKNGRKKELNIVMFMSPNLPNGKTVKYDIRDWDKEHKSPSGGILFTELELQGLHKLLVERYGTNPV